MMSKLTYHNLDIKNFTYSHVCNTTYPYESTLNSRHYYNTKEEAILVLIAFLEETIKMLRRYI